MGNYVSDWGITSAPDPQPGELRERRHPVPAAVGGLVAVAGPAEQGGALRGGLRLSAADRGGIHQPQRLGPARGAPTQPAQRGLHQRRSTLEPLVVLALAKEAGE